jgi:DNA-binding NarL/FixJ family response regulator
MPIRIAIVDDKSQNRVILSEQIGLSKSFSVVFIAKNGVDFLEKMKHLDKKQHPQVVLMDIEMPEMNGIETVSQAHSLYPDTNFLMLTVFDDDEKIFDAIKAGATGYLLKDEKISIIEDHMQQLVEIGGIPMSPSIARKAMNMLVNVRSPVHAQHKEDQTHSEHELSDRELEVLKLLVNGYDYKIIAEKLFLSSHTVRKHIANIYSKLHVSSKAQAINLAYQKKWV